MNVINTTFKSISFSWEEPWSHAPISHYVLLILNSDGTTVVNMATNQTSAVREHTFDNLEENTVHLLRVSAVSENAEGRFLQVQVSTVQSNRKLLLTVDLLVIFSVGLHLLHTCAFSMYSTCVKCSLFKSIISQCTYIQMHSVLNTLTYMSYAHTYVFVLFLPFHIYLYCSLSEWFITCTYCTYIPHTVYVRTYMWK